MLTLYLPTGRAALAPIGDPNPPCIGGYYEKGSDPNGSLPFFLCSCNRRFTCYFTYHFTRHFTRLFYIVDGGFFVSIVELN